MDWVNSRIRESNLSLSGLASGNIHRGRQSTGERLRQVLQRKSRASHGAVSEKARWMYSAALECSVADELGVKSTIAREVDIL